VILILLQFCLNLNFFTGADTRDLVKHDTLKHLSTDPDTHKLILDDELHWLNSSHSAVIHNLEKMPAETATLLHGFCDNDNAPYKRVRENYTK